MADNVKRMKDKIEARLKLLRQNRHDRYTLTDVTQMEMIPWVSSYRTVRSLIHSDMRNDNLLDVEITGRDSQRRYTVTAKGLIKYLLEYGPAMMVMARNHKKNGSRK